MGSRARAFGDCTRLTRGCLGEEQKAGKGMGLGGLGMNKHEKMEARGIKGTGCM